MSASASSNSSPYRFIGNTLQFTKSLPKNVLVVRRFYGDTFSQYARILKFILQHFPNHKIFLEEKERLEIQEHALQLFGSEALPKIAFIGTCDLKQRDCQKALLSIDLVITLGGDGTLLYAASLFQKPNHHCPPFLPIALGSLGFLTPIKLERFEEAVTRILSRESRPRSDTSEFNQELLETQNSNSLNNSLVKGPGQGLGQTQTEILSADTSSFNDDGDCPLSMSKNTYHMQVSIGEPSRRYRTAYQSESEERSPEDDKKSSLPVPRLRSNIPESQLFNADEPIFITKRIRLYVKVKDLSSPHLSSPNSASSSSAKTSLSARNSSSLTKLDENSASEYLTSSARRYVLNEVVIDRGPNHGMVHLQIYVNDKMIADVRGDGLIISTPTGSTAYSLSAGASIVHPSSAGVILTPICPHSLSLRPFMIPPGVKLVIKKAADSRTQPWVSFDGRDAHSLDQNTEISVILPEKVEEHGGFVIPCVCLRDPVDDFFTSLSTCLSWNNSQFTAKDM